MATIRNITHSSFKAQKAGSSITDKEETVINFSSSLINFTNASQQL
jgi:hypothetical protein